MSPASYRAAPPRVVNTTLRDALDQRKSVPAGCGKRGVAGPADPVTPATHSRIPALCGQLLVQSLTEPGGPLRDLRRAQLDRTRAPALPLGELAAAGGQQGQPQRGPAVAVV